MAGNSELFQALQMFQQGVQQAATTSAVNDAAAAVQDIHSNIVDQGQQRQALDQLSKMTALRLTGTGANGTQIQSAFQAIAPKQYQSAQEMQIDAALNGNKQLGSEADTIQKKQVAQQKDMLGYEYGLKDAMEEKKFQRDYNLEAMKLSKSPISPEDVTFRTNINVGNKLLDDLQSTIKKYGTAETGMGSKDSQIASAKLNSLPYQLAIIYAKTADPSARITKDKIEADMKYLFPVGWDVTADKAQASLDNVRQTLQLYQQQRQVSAQSPGDSNFPQMARQAGGSFNLPGAPGHQPPEAPIETRTLKDGRQVKVRQVANGQWEIVQ